VVLYRLALLLVVRVILLAQSTATLVGTVEDSSGAVVPGAVVLVINEATGERASINTDNAGRFTFPRLPVGNYRLSAVQPGFRQFLTEGIRLDADQSRHASIMLELGETSEQVTVTGTVGLVETRGATLKEVVDEKRIVELPLNGRNPLQLQLLLPGVLPSKGSVGLTQNEYVSVNGARGNQNNYMLDGGDNNDPLTNSASRVPNPDALEEFSILTNNYGAEYGRNTGAVVNAITKSGTNKLHGVLYEFVRNDAVDARGFFSLETPKLRRNQFGATLGGPVWLPRLYKGHDRTFFFFSTEGVRERKEDTVSELIAPTALERQGDFSLSARKPSDPLTRQLFPGNRIPQARFDPAARNLLNLLIPPPNTSTGQYIFNQPLEVDSSQVLTRIDHLPATSHRITGRVFYDTTRTLHTRTVPALRSTENFHTWHAVGNHTWTMSPALLNTAQFTFGRVDLKQGPEPVLDGLTYQSLGVNVNSDTPQFPTNFRGVVSGYWSLDQENLVTIDRKTFQATDTVSYARGAHLLKWGGESRLTRSDRVTASMTDPLFTFDGRFTSDAFADFLIGRPSRMQQASLRQNQGRSRAFSMFIQDDYKVRRNLTLSFGLRWEPYFPFYDADDQVAIFRPGQQSTVFPNAPRGLIYAGDTGVPRGGVPNDWNNLAPRFGFAWTPFRGGKTSFRGAYGVFYDTPNYYQLTGFVSTQPYSMVLSVPEPYSFSDPYRGITNPFPYTPPSTEAERRSFVFTTPVAIGESLDADLVNAYVQQWNFNVQQEVVQRIVLTAAYVGSKGTHLPIQRGLNPGVFRPGATAANLETRRIYSPTFAGIPSYESTGSSSYHALQLSVNKRFSRGYTLLANYTYGKALDIGSLDVIGFFQNTLDIRSEKGRSDNDVRQRFVASFLWELPSPNERLSRAVFGGWQLNGIYTASSGAPVNVVSGRDQALAGAGAQRPNLIGDPHLDNGRPRAQLLEQYFNPSAFSLPTLGQFGNFGRNVLDAPVGYTLDASIFRSLPIAERVRLQFRGEFFNALNHANLGSPVANISSATVGRILTASSPRILQFGLKLIY
jgi:outer membrane receptor protein involved in Fe transport